MVLPSEGRKEESAVQGNGLRILERGILRFVKETGLFRSSGAPPRIHNEFYTLNPMRLLSLHRFVSILRKEGGLPVGFGKGRHQAVRVLPGTVQGAC